MISTRLYLKPALLAVIGLSLLGGLATQPAQAAPPPGNPLHGNGMWIWYAPKPGQIDRTIQQLQDAHVDTVFIKSGDSTQYWEQFNRALVERFQAAGIHVCAWHYVYGTRPRSEARISARAYREGAECFIIDAETEYEGRPRAAWHYTHELRRLTSPRWIVGLSTFPYLKYHSRFPYRTFLRKGAATVNLPQMYWKTIGVSPAQIMRDTYQANRRLGRPVYPIGQTWQTPGRGEIQAFQQAARDAGAKGVSWWDWSQTSRSGWQELREKNFFPEANLKQQKTSRVKTTARPKSKQSPQQNNPLHPIQSLMAKLGVSAGS